MHAVGNCILLVSMTDLKYGKLEGAFLYALDESMNSIGAADLEQCFGDNLKALGNNIQMAFVNMISRTEKRMENEFQHISAKHRVRAALARSYTPPPPADTARCTHDSERSLLEAKKALMRAELDEVANRIRLLVSLLPASIALQFTHPTVSGTREQAVNGGGGSATHAAVQ